MPNRSPRPPIIARGNFFKVLGPGLLFAGAAVGVSHLVQSTRAGAVYGLALVVIVLLANVFKYPAFAFGPRYAAATGTSLLEGYRRQGKWALALYAVLTLGTMFTVQAAVTIVTGALLQVTLGVVFGVSISPDAPGFVQWLLGPVGLSLLVTIVCASICGLGRFRLLERITRVVVLLLTLATFAATILVVDRVDWSGPWLLDFGAIDAKTIAFLAALIGWMPSAVDVSVWHSLWTLAKRRTTGHRPSVREAMLDFNIGYIGTALLAFCFILLGAGVMHPTGVTPVPAAAGFAAQVIGLYTETLGAWSAPLISFCALGVMFSTTLTVIDGFPRAIATLVKRFGTPEDPDLLEPLPRRPYWIALGVLGLGSVLILSFAQSSLPSLIDLATTLSFLTAPALAILNHRAITGAEVPAESRPSRALIAYSLAGIVFLVGVAGVWVYVLVAG